MFQQYLVQAHINLPKVVHASFSSSSIQFLKHFEPVLCYCSQLSGCGHRYSFWYGEKLPALSLVCEKA